MQLCAEQKQNNSIYLNHLNRTHTLIIIVYASGRAAANGRIVVELKIKKRDSAKLDTRREICDTFNKDYTYVYVNINSTCVWVNCCCC